MKITEVKFGLTVGTGVKFEFKRVDATATVGDGESPMAVGRALVAFVTALSGDIAVALDEIDRAELDQARWEAPEGYFKVLPKALVERVRNDAGVQQD